MATEPEFLVAKDQMLVALATVSVVILSPGLAARAGFCACVKPTVLTCKGKWPNWQDSRNFNAGFL